MIVKKAVHGFCEAGMLEDDGGPGGTGKDGVEQGDHADMTVEDSEFHGEV